MPPYGPVFFGVREGQASTKPEAVSRFEFGGWSANVLLHRLQVAGGRGRNLFWRDLQRDEVTRSCGEVNDLIKGPLGKVSPASDLADG